MTAVELDAGRDLDALIATTVMGWHTETDYDYKPTQDDWVDISGAHTCYLVNTKWQSEHLRKWGQIWEPSTDITCAWAVVERMRDLGWWPKLTWLQDWDLALKWWAAFDKPPLTWYRTAPSAPLAICRAALFALGAA